MMNRVATGLAAVVVAGGVLTACGSADSVVGPSTGGSTPSATTSGASTTSAIAGCSPSTMKTLKPGYLTLGADQPVYPPWYVANDPTNGKGFEDAVSYAIAKELGFSTTQVKWTRVGFTQAIAEAKKNFDFDLDEFSITAAREERVDFSAPYYDVNEAIVALKGTKGAAVTTLAGAQGLKLGAQIGTTSAIAITNFVKPTQSPALFTTNSLAVQALKNGQIDGLVVDLPTAFYITSAQIKGSVIVGQIPETGGKPEQFGALLSKGSPLTSCVSKAVNALKADGTLASIQHKWLAQVGKAPVLQ